MPILNWLTRDEDIQATKSVPYRLLEEAKRGQVLNREFWSQPGREDRWPKTYNSRPDRPTLFLGRAGREAIRTIAHL